MTEKGSTANQNVYLVQIVRLVPGGFGTKGTFSQNHMRAILSSICSGNSMTVTIFQNCFGRNIERLVVSTDKDGREASARNTGRIDMMWEVQMSKCIASGECSVTVMRVIVYYSAVGE
jgi:hypothetical protein